MKITNEDKFLTKAWKQKLPLSSKNIIDVKVFATTGHKENSYFGSNPNMAFFIFDYNGITLINESFLTNSFSISDADEAIDLEIEDFNEAFIAQSVSGYVIDHAHKLLTLHKSSLSFIKPDDLSNDMFSFFMTNKKFLKKIRLLNNAPNIEEFIYQ